MMLSGDGNSTDLVPATSVELVNPFTGEVLSLSLDSATEDLGRALADLREHASDVRSAVRAISDEVLRRQDLEARWTTPLPGMVLVGSTPQPVEEFDGAALREELLRFVDWGSLSIEAVDAAVETVITYKVHKSGVNALRKLGGRIAEAVDEHARKVDRERYVKVERLG